MLKWCAYCQQFLGEVPDYQRLTITHGICARCAPRALELTEAHIERAQVLLDIQQQLHEAGRRNDLAAADRIIETAAKMNVRSIDILMGILAPMLYQFGEDWRRNLVSVADEHRFTSYCEAVFERIASQMQSLSSRVAAAPRQPDTLLMNAPGNRHTLAIRVLALWLRDKGTSVRTIDLPLPLEELITLVVACRTRIVLISMALAEQLSGVAEIVARIADIPASIRPRVIVGGYAVKAGLVSTINGADLAGDISML